jgi:hypothetical protein
MTGLDQFDLEIHPVLDDAVVDHHYFTSTIEMGMGVAGVGSTVSGPPGVPDPGVGLGRRFEVHETLEVGDPPSLFEDGDRVPVVEGNAGRVIASILEPGEAGHQDVEDRARTHISDYSAHISSFDGS